jgi:surface antigen
VKIAVVMLCLVVVTVGCATQTQSGAAVGALSGAGFGAMVGGAVGGKQGALLGAALGAATGAAVGGLIGNRLDARDKAKRDAALQDSMKATGPDQHVTWVNPDTGGSGTITLVNQDPSGGVPGVVS